MRHAVASRGRFEFRLRCSAQVEAQIGDGVSVQLMHFTYHTLPAVAAPSFCGNTCSLLALKISIVTEPTLTNEFHKRRKATAGSVGSDKIVVITFKQCLFPE